MYLFVYNKVQNYFTTKKAESLVYIYCNNKLEHQTQGHNPTLLYENYFEDANTKEENRKDLSSTSLKNYQGIQH